jgi:hypothetical protein
MISIHFLHHLEAIRWIFAKDLNQKFSRATDERKLQTVACKRLLGNGLRILGLPRKYFMITRFYSRTPRDTNVPKILSVQVNVIRDPSREAVPMH